MPKAKKPQLQSPSENGPGACFITDPQTGEVRCRLMTQAACATAGGVFQGGPCDNED